MQKSLSLESRQATRPKAENGGDRRSTQKTPRKTRATQKCLSLEKKVQRNFWKVGKRLGQKQKKEKTEGANRTRQR